MAHLRNELIAKVSSKRLYVSFRGSDSISDILGDAKIYPVINEYSGRFHSGFFKRAENVPIDYFIKKLIDGNELVFTGHSLGAAVGAMVTINLLYLPDMTHKYSNKIYFVGYGCPSIADIYFKKDINEKYKNNLN